MKNAHILAITFVAGLMVGCSFPTHAAMQTIDYRCQLEPAPISGLWQEVKSQLNIDLQTGEIGGFTMAGRQLHGFAYNSNDTQLNQLPNSKEAPAIASYYQPDSSDGFGISFVVYGKTEGVKSGDVMFYMPADNGEAFWCYRVDSLKDQAMHGLTQSHNKRVSGE